MMLDQAVAEFERGRTVVLGLAGCLSQTGEPYAIICSGDEKQEGEEYPLIALHSPPEDDGPTFAIGSWLSAAKEYARIRAGVLYWRVRPRLEMVPWTIIRAEHVGYVVYSRMLISERPVLQQEAT